ncbi:MAG TPA: serine/threonine-protein kinase, partial [Candidatus Polarisedimenticolia bacterium]|nr:serine/threonine-protein kinase [Candidatus Polarisedimenticolia bacterium]
QRSPRRRVALKVVRGEAALDDNHLMLFRREVEVLARLEHPMIARIYDSGRTPEGRHFFAMELVRGRTLDAAMRIETPLDEAETRRRLALLADVADAVHYAHQRGVIHRDLKPSNLVVTEEATAPGASGPGVKAGSGPGAARAAVKILDFGVARITDEDVRATKMTEIGVVRGTLSYMSPEQASGRPDAIDVRTDVYALGVILYEMLTGALPLDLSKASLAQAVRILEEAPPRPLRQAWQGSARLDEDVETIVAKALEKDPKDRYGSAAALAEDLRRWLDSKPILARPPSTLYQMRKFVRRNPLPTAFAATLLMLLVGFAVAMGWQAKRVAAERDRAQAAADKAEAINRFLQETLQVANPDVGGSHQTTILEALDQSLDRIGKTFAGQPVLEADVRETLGETYNTLSEFAKTEEQLKRALELRLAQLGPLHTDTGTTYGALSRLYHQTARYDEAIDAAQKGIAAERAASGPRHIRLAERLNDLGYAYYFAGKPQEAEKPVAEALEIGRAWPEGPTYPLGESLVLMGNSLASEGKLEEGAKLLQEAVDVAAKVLGPTNGETDNARNSLAMVLMQQEQYDRAEALLLQVLEDEKATLGPKHPKIAVTLENLGNIYYRQGHLDKTIEMLDQTAALRREVLGPEDPAVGRTLCNRGTVQWRAGHLEEAERSMREGLALMSKGLGADHPDVAQVYGTFALILSDRKDGAGAERALREALRIRTKALGDDNPATASSRIDLGLNLLARKVKEAEAKTHLRDGVAVLAKSAGEDNPRVKKARAALGEAVSSAPATGVPAH